MRQGMLLNMHLSATFRNVWRKGVRAAAPALMAALAFLPLIVAAESRPERVRLAAVNAPAQSGLLEHLLKDFETRSGYRVEVHGSSDPYGRARGGHADLVLSHYGKAEVEAFVRSGLGLWPRMVFSNQMVLIGPATDPAGIAGIDDPVEAIRRMAERKATLLVGPNTGSRYMTELLLAVAGDAGRNVRVEPVDRRRGQLVSAAESRDAYLLWGAFPFARYQARNPTRMRMMASDSPLLHRVMATVRVNPARIDGVNAEGAARLESWLLSPEAQAAVLAFREDGKDRPTWWPAARNNASSALAGSPLGDDEDF